MCSFGSFSAQKALLVLADYTLNVRDDYFRITVPCRLERTQTPNDVLLPHLSLPPRAGQPGSQLMPHPQSLVPSRLEALELAHPNQDVRSSWKRDANNQTLPTPLCPITITISKKEEKTLHSDWR